MSGQTQQKNPGIQKETLLKELEASLEKERDKVTKIGKIIEKLEEAKSNIISKKGGQESTSYSRILEKYITFLEYIRSIIEAKIRKDEKITELQWEVFYRIDIIGQGINLTKKKLGDIENTSPTNEEIKKDQNQLRSLREESDRLNNQLNKKNKQYLLDFNASDSGVDLYDINGNKKLVLHEAEADLLSCTQNIQKAIQDFNAALTENQSGGMNITEQKSSEMKDYTSDDKEQFKDIIDSLFIINNTNDQKINILKTNNLKTNIINNNNNSKNKIRDKQNEHTDKLKKIKEAYEEGLKKNIDDFRAICDALKNLVEEVAKKTEILRENINQIKQNVNANKTEREKQITAIQEKINKNKSNKEEIKKLKQEIEGKKKANLENKIMLKVLDIGFLGNDVFKANHEALVGEDRKSGLLKKITNAQETLNKAEIKVEDVIVNNANPGIGQQSQGPGNPDQGPGQQVQGQDTSNTASTVSNVSTISSDIKFALDGIRLIDINQLEDITDNTFADLEQITNKMRELQDQEEDVREDVLNELMQGDVPTTQIKPQNILTQNKTPQNVEPLNVIPSNQHNKYNRIVERINNANSRVEQISIFIYVMKKFTNADKIKKILNKAVRDENLFRGTSKIVLQKINTANGGKYKMKKSKKSKSKSKTTKTTPKKAKSTKKPRTTRTQTKSYNNPKYKNQDGGFVRGGVLFPESFYRSDIVM